MRLFAAFRWALIPLIAALLLALLLPAPLAAALEPPHWQRSDVEIELRPNGEFLVTEKQTVLFGQGAARHGFREIPLSRVERIVDVSVSEPAQNYQRVGAPSNLRVKQDGDAVRLQASYPEPVAESPYSYRVETKDGNLRIDWWFPPTASAPRTFLIRYRVVGGLRYYPGGDQLYWNGQHLGG